MSSPLSPEQQQKLRALVDADAQGFRVEAPESLEVIEGFWFAWSAFHPETSVATAPRE